MIYDDKKFIGQVIKNARRKAKLTQFQLAEAVGMSEKNLGNIENGKQFPQVNNFLHIIEVLNISLLEFGVNREISAAESRQKLIKLALTSESKHVENYCRIFELIRLISD